MKDKLAQQIADLGIEVSDKPEELNRLSHDASLFEIQPQLAVFPRSSAEIKLLVQFVEKQKKFHPNLSLTVRSGGTDMSGGAINDSIIVDVSRYMNQLGEVQDSTITAQPGAYYRHLDLKTKARELILPSYPASRDICTIGGMVANDSGGEKTLSYGKTHDYVQKLKMVLHDGQEYVFQPLSKTNLRKLIATNSQLAKIHKELFNLVLNQQETIKHHRPDVSKNSSGYNVWDAWDGKTFDPTKIIVGSQGTLGIITEATCKLVPTRALSGMIIAFLPSITHLSSIINEAIKLRPSSLESFDEHTLKFAFRFFVKFHKTLGTKRFIGLGLSFIPVLGKLLSTSLDLPKIILMVEFEAEKQDEIDSKLDKLEVRLEESGITSQRAKTRRQEEKFWTLRRESFNLLRKNVKNKHAAPFIDDLIVAPRHLPKFLPRLEAILDKHQLLYTVAGHMGDGNFHIIPLMDLAQSLERDKIYPILHEVSNLVLSFKGSLSAEHNDGLIRGPLLGQMYGTEMLRLFGQIKQIFDPQNIFNPHKKLDATEKFSKAHIRRYF